MKLKKAAAVLMAGVFVLSMLAGCGDGESTGGDSGDKKSEGKKDGKVTIAQSMPTLNNPWYVLYANGSKDMAKKLGADITQVTNPEANAWSPDAQISKIENLIAKSPDVIEIDPTSTDTLNSVIQEAQSKGIKVVTSGTNVTTDVEAAIVADNKHGGKLCGEFLGEELGGKGKVVILQGTPGRDVIQARESGFEEAISKFDDIEIVAKQVADLERAEAVSKMETILQANPDIDAVWAANDEMALGAVEALRARNLAGKVKVGGFDCTPDAITAIEEGEMHFTANQIPYEIGARAIAISVALTKGIDVKETHVELPMSIVSYKDVKDYVANEKKDQEALIEKLIEEYGLK